MSQKEKRRLPRQKRSIEKVGLILDAVETLVVSHGPDAVTTTQIAEVTGFAVGTIYQYFSNRTDILMSGGQMTTPIVFRGPNGAAARVAAQHSQCYASWYSHIPGLKVVMCLD